MNGKKEIDKEKDNICREPAASELSLLVLVGGTVRE